MAAQVKRPGVKPQATAVLKRRRFAAELFTGKTQTAAAKAAGFAGTHQQASNLARDPVVVAELERLRGKMERASIATREEAAELYTRHMRATFADLIDAQGEINLSDARKRNVLHLIRSVERKVTESSTTTKIELVDPKAAADSLVRLEGWAKAAKLDVSHAVKPASEMSDAELEAAEAELAAAGYLRAKR